MSEIPRFDRIPDSPRRWLENEKRLGKKYSSFTLKDLMGDDWTEIKSSVAKDETKMKKSVPQAGKTKAFGIVSDVKNEAGAVSTSHSKLVNKWGTVYSPGCSPLSPQQPTESRIQEKVYQEKVFGKWLAQKFEKICSQWKVHWNCEIPVEARGYLAPYFMSEKYRPDIWIGVTFEAVLYQLLLVEMLSKKDLDLTVAECQRNLIHQLRVYRNYDISVKCVTGFVIPTAEDPCPLLKVYMSWEDVGVKFRSGLEIIHAKEHLIEQIILVAKQHQSLIDSKNFKQLFLPIDATKYSFDEPAIQLHAGQSVVVATEKRIFKLIINSQVYTTLTANFAQYYRNVAKLDCICLPKLLHDDDDDVNIFLYKTLFMKFEKLIYPLSRAEASECLRDWLKKTATALQGLHTIGQCAHLDVRLENIAFRTKDNDVIAVLIDLETVSPRYYKPSLLSSASNMNCFPTKATNREDYIHFWIGGN